MPSTLSFNDALALTLNVEASTWSKLILLALGIYLLCPNVVVKNSKLPSVGVTNWPCSNALATLHSVTNFRALLSEAYNKYLSRGLPCRIPDVIFGPLVVLPASKLKWMLSQREHVLHPTEAQHELVQMNTLLWYAKVPFEQPMHGFFPRKWMSRRFESPKDALRYEIGQEISERWGNDTQEWKDVNIYMTIRPVLARATWEAFVGQPTCQCSDLWHYGQMIADFIFPIAQIVRLFPPFMRPVVAKILGLPLRYAYYRLSKVLIPVIRRRIEELKDAAESGNVESSDQFPNDYMGFLIQHDLQRGKLSEHTPHRVCSLLAGVNFAASQSITITATNALRCLTYSPSGNAHLESLHTQVKRVIQEEDNQWTKNCLSKLTLPDSTLRETMRLCPGLPTAPIRTLRQDIEFDDGIRLPTGTKIGIPAYSLHIDDTIYPNPLEFDPFRFAREREERGTQQPSSGTEVGDDDELKEPPKAQPTPLVALADTWFGWGAGRSACPGRFLASDAMKLVLADAVLNYEIRPIGGRNDGYDDDRMKLKQRWLGSVFLPDRHSMITVRRRPNT